MKKIVGSNKPKPKPKPPGTIGTGLVPLPLDLRSDKPQIMFCRIGPLEAQRLLEHNTANRKMVQRTIDRYTRDIAHERFDLSNDAISIYTSGKLATGQHRCAAVIKAVRPFVSLVLLGLPEAAAVKLDQPVPRKAYQNLHILGELTGVETDTNSTDIAAARMLVGPPASAMTMDELQWVLAEYEEPLAFAKQHAHASVAPVRAGIAAAYRARVNRDALVRFCEVLADGIANGRHESAAVKLREKLPKLGGGGTGRMEQRRLTMNAIKHFVKGHDTQKLVIPDTDIYPLGSINEENI